jgi:hypothetical protein
VQKILETVKIPGSAAPNAKYGQCQLFKKFKYENFFKIKNKPDPVLLNKKRIAKSRETIPLRLADLNARCAIDPEIQLRIKTVLNN